MGTCTLLIFISIVCCACCGRVVKLDHSAVRIIQFTDLHMGESDDKDWMTINLMRAILSKEKPDFIVFTGDQVAGYEVISSKQKEVLWQRALSIAAEFHIPFATLFGNHDDQPYHFELSLWNGIAINLFCFELVFCLIALFTAGDKRRITWFVLFLSLALVLVFVLVTNSSRAVRMALVEHEHRVYPTLSYTEMGPEEIYGVSNYRITLEITGTLVPLYFIDSGGGMISNAIQPNQLDWLNSFDSSQYALAFVHVPPVQFNHLFSYQCMGDAPNEASSECPGSGRLLKILHSIGVRALFVGHDHGNSWCCPLDTMLLCYGKHSGFGGYDFNETLRGARVIDIDVSEGISVTTRLSLWDSMSY